MQDIATLSAVGDLMLRPRLPVFPSFNPQGQNWLISAPLLCGALRHLFKQFLDAWQAAPFSPPLFSLSSALSRAPLDLPLSRQTKLERTTKVFRPGCLFPNQIKPNPKSSNQNPRRGRSNMAAARTDGKTYYSNSQVRSRIRLAPPVIKS